jgi:hypothetical protein
MAKKASKKSAKKSASKKDAAGRKKLLKRIRKEVDKAHKSAVAQLMGPPQVYAKVDEHMKTGGYFKGSKGYVK